MIKSQVYFCFCFDSNCSLGGWLLAGLSKLSVNRRTYMDVVVRDSSVFKNQHHASHHSRVAYTSRAPCRVTWLCSRGQSERGRIVERENDTAAGSIVSYAGINDRRCRLQRTHAELWSASRTTQQHPPPATSSYMIGIFISFITGPPTHSAGGQTSNTR